MNDHICKFFIHSVKADFEPLGPVRTDKDGTLIENGYQRVEYAFSGCNCGNSVKTKVLHKPNDTVLQ